MKYAKLINTSNVKVMATEERHKRKSVVEEEGADRVRKQSKLEREEELVRMAMRKSSRKVVNLS